MDSHIGKGYLVLADISGFTRFVADNELDHARVILGDILKLIIGQFSPRLRIAEIEGDAVFAYVPEERFPRGETLVEIIESTYVGFRDKQRSGLRTATCTCTACQTVGDLDLKFIVHHGDFVLQKLNGNVKPLGTSVNLLHRLAKNSVQENTAGVAMLSLPTRRSCRWRSSSPLFTAKLNGMNTLAMLRPLPSTFTIATTI